MNKGIIEVHFQDWNSFKAEMRESLVKRKPSIQPKYKIYFESNESFRKFMTLHKIELLSVIRAKQPDSIYELAKIVNRDFGSVLKDCHGLAGVGFIILEEVGDVRNTKRPKLSFNYSAIAIFAPTVKYNVVLPEAA